MGSRIRENPAHVFACFCEVVIPNEIEKKPWILQKYPDDYDNQEVLKSVPDFSCPCEFTNAAIQHFSFVLTSLDSKWTFGYCRNVPKSPTIIVILSFLPWNETFYKILNQIAELMNSKDTHLLTKFLKTLYYSPVPEPGFNLHISYDPKDFIVYCPNHLKLPSIPENRNLTEYFNAIDAHNMMVIFASMLHERRILVTSKKLSRLSACVQAANSLIYPMHWQHIFIPVLPKHLIDYLSAPMPFLIGVPSVTMIQIRQSELSEVVLLDADNNRVRTPFKDLETLPHEIVSSLKRSLKNPNLMLGDGVSRAFMRALVHLIGGYRDSLKFTLGQKISFDADTFIRTRPASIQPFLETMLHLQIFQQFIEDRLDMLNSGTGFSDEFEYEVNSYEVYSSNNLKTQYKEWVTTMKKEGGAFLKNVKSRTNPAVKYAYKSVKDKSKRAYKDLRSKIQKHPSQTDLRFDQKFGKPKSAPSSPTSQRPSRYGNKTISYNQNSIRKNGVLDAMTLPNSMSVTGIRHYKMLNVDDINESSEENVFSSEQYNSNNIQRLNMDLMGDLHDVIYRRCSVSSDNLNVLGLEKSIQEEKSNAASMGFADSFCDSSDVFLPTPIAPPRTKRTAKPIQKAQTVDLSSLQDTVGFQEPALIQLESLDEVALFDPLKADNMKDTNLLPFMTTSKTPSNDVRVAELKDTIQNLAMTSTVYPVCSQPNNPYFNNTSSRIPQHMVPPAQSAFLRQHALLGSTIMSNVLLGSQAHNPGGVQHNPGHNLGGVQHNPTYSAGGIQHNLKRVTQNPNSVPHNSGVLRNSTKQEKKPPLPPKTRISSSTFFVSTGELSKADHDLLEDYGIGDSPIFSQSSTGGSSSSCPSSDTNLFCPSNSTFNSASPSSMSSFNSADSKKSTSSGSQDDFKVQPSWQKFA